MTLQTDSPREGFGYKHRQEGLSPGPHPSSYSAQHSAEMSLEAAFVFFAGKKKNKTSKKKIKRIIGKQSAPTGLQRTAKGSRDTGGHSPACCSAPAPQPPMVPISGHCRAVHFGKQLTRPTTQISEFLHPVRNQPIETALPPPGRCDAHPH